MSGPEASLISGREAVDHVISIWEEKTGEEPPIHEVELLEDRVVHNHSNFANGVVEVSEQMKEDHLGVFERNLLTDLDSAYERVLEEQVEE